MSDASQTTSVYAGLPDVAGRIGATDVRLCFERRRDPRFCDWHVLVEFEGVGRMYMLEIQTGGRIDAPPSLAAIEVGARAVAEHLKAMDGPLD